MPGINGDKISSYSLNFIWLGLGLALISWGLESLVHFLFFPQGNLISELLTADTHEIWKRILVMGLIIAFSVYAQNSIQIRRRAEAALKERERELTKILENSPAGIIIVESGTNTIRWANSNALRMIGSAKAAVEGQNCERFLFAGERQDCLGNDLIRNSNQTEGLLRTAGGTSLPILKNNTRVKYDDCECILEIFLDLSERKKLEYETKLVNAELDQIFQTASVGMRVVSRDFRILKVNQTLEKMTGVNQKDSVGQKCRDLFGGLTCATENCSLKLILEGKEKVEHYVEKLRPDGCLVPCIVSATPFKGPDGGILGIVEAFQDISALKNAQQTLKLERDKLKHILTHLSEGICIINTDCIIEYHNSVFSEFFGSCEGKRCYESLRCATVPCAHCIMHEVLDTGKIQYAEFTTPNERTYEQSYTHILDIDEKSKAIVLIRDVTEKNAHMNDLMRAEQLAALGEMAAGVAHEINNPINGIINYAQILANKNPGNQLFEDILQRVIKEGKRIARIVQGLVAFAQRGKRKNTLFSIEEVLSDSIVITGAQMRKDKIALQTKIAPNLPRIGGQANEIEQVFINLIINAIHALNLKYPDGHANKCLKISAEQVNTSDSPHVRISFHDQGTGIPAHLIDKVRNPFFSTKTDGKHTGLGLSISHGIVNEHRGRLKIESTEGVYTCVSVELPNSQTDGKANHE